MDEGDGVDEWVREAMENEEISAGVLLTLRKSTGPRLLQPKFLEWGQRRRRRGRGGGGSGGSRDRKAGVRRTESPTTPMEFSSSASASGGDEPSGAASLGYEAVAKESLPPLVDADGCLQATKSVVTGGWEPTALRISAAAVAKPFRRPGKRMTISELLDLEKLRQDDRMALRKEREGLLLKREVLRGENQRLQRLKLQLQEGGAIAAVSNSELQGHTSFFQLPDLNEPVVAEFNCLTS